MLASLNAATIGELDSGLAGAAIDQAIDQAVRDVEDRGEDGRPRKVVIELIFTKEDNCHVAIDVTANAKLPPYRLGKTIADMAADKDRKAMKAQFRTTNGARPDQPTIEDVMNEDEE